MRTVINPLLAEGQRHGGIAQGAAQAFLEEVIYDADGNPLTATLADYPFLSATEVPSFELGGGGPGGLEGNFCRCTGYHNIVRAVLAAAETMSA